MGPTDGTGPTEAGAEPAGDAMPASADVAAGAGDATPDVGARRQPEPGPGAPTRDEMTLALTPGQLAVGGAIVAGLLVVGARLILGRRRRGDGS